MRTVDIKVKPNSRQNSVKEAGNTLFVKLTKSPQKGKANKQLLAVIAEHFGVKTSQVIIVSGDTSNIKRVSIIEDYR